MTESGFCAASKKQQKEPIKLRYLQSLMTTRKTYRLREPPEIGKQLTPPISATNLVSATLFAVSHIC